LFESYRALGYYASGLPLSVFKSDQDILIASAVGDHAFYVYDSAHLNLAYMSKYIAQTITWIQATTDGFVYTALNSDDSSQTIVCWKKMHKVIEYTGHKEKIIKFICVGDFIFSLAAKGEFIIFNRQSGEVIKQMTFGNDDQTYPDDFMHPNTYMNKLVFACGSKLELWNIMTPEMIF
jgi:hypothetical protein